MNTQRYGNEHYWCFLEGISHCKYVAIWKSAPNANGEPAIIAYATGEFEAKEIVDALLVNYNNIDKNKLGKKEIVFLEFVKANCIEPYATMASNAILWNDVSVYNKLKSDFSVIYS